MGLALKQAEKALALGEFPVGCIFVANDEVVASGSRTNSNTTINELDHAEIIALKNFLKNQAAIKPKEVTLYCTLEPCLMCFATLIINDITKIIYAYEDAMGGGTTVNLKELPRLYQEKEVTITAGLKRQESLDLFKEFFNNPQVTYLKNSYLAQYTLAQ